MIQSTILFDVSVIIAAATILAFIAHVFKQPIIPAYVIAGILIGPVGYGLVANTEVIAMFSEFGIALLLFIVGLEMSINRIKNVGFTSSVIGTAQVGVITLIGFFAAVALGFDHMEALYLGLILALSSTMVVIKLLSDKNELDTLHGRLMLGVLLVQDIIVIIVMSVFINLANPSALVLGMQLLRGLGLLAIAIVCSRYVLPRLLKFVTDSQELLLLFSLSWLLIFSTIVYYSGFSIAIGAFIAGVGLATFPYNIEIMARLQSLKDFFVTIFFVSLGIQIVPRVLTLVLAPLAIFILITLLLKPFVTQIFCRMFRYGKRTSFLTSIGLAQTSEFSLILALQGMMLGHVSQDFFSITILITIATMSVATYLIRYDNKVYEKFMPFLKHVGGTHEEEKLESLPKNIEDHIIICGCHRMGSEIVKVLEKRRKKFIVIDFDPDIITGLISRGVSCIYGDVSDMDILKRANISKARMVISTIPDVADNMLLIAMFKEHRKDKPIFVTSPRLDEALGLYEKGADYVIMPRKLSGEEIAEMLKHKLGIGKIKKKKSKHIKDLLQQKEDEILEKYQVEFLKPLKKEKAPTQE